MALDIHRHHGSHNVSKRTQAVRWIVMHYVGSGTSAAGSALANCKYFAGGNRGASAHYFVDDSGVWEYADPATYATWHCGDGKGKFGITNANSIGVEVCVNGDRPYTAKEIMYATELVRHLMEAFGVDAAHVVRHYDASRKACPFYYTPEGSGGDAAWDTLHKVLTGSKFIEEDEVTEEDIQRIAGAVWSYNYDNSAPGGTMYNALLFELPYKTIPQETWEYVYGDADTNCYNALHWGYQYVQQLTVQVEALNAAVKALAEAQGADPDAVAKAVSDAVAAKLESIDLSVTVAK